MKIDITLSTRSINDAVKKLNKYADSLQAKSEKLVQTLGEYGLDLAKKNLDHVDTGKTLGSLSFTRDKASGTISVGGAAVWIEFGTGVRYNTGSPHEKAAELGICKWGTYHYGLGSNPNGWYYKGADGKKHHTFGIQMNSFMWDSAKAMRRDLERFAKEAFRE